MPTMNLFEPCTGLTALQEIYRLPDCMVARIMNRCIVRNGIDYEIPDNGVSIFLEETGIHPDTFDVSDVKVHCKHITTAFDEGESIKTRGLLPLNRLLEEESAISSFLCENGIEVSPSRHQIQIDGHKYRIPESSKDCSYDVWEIYAYLSPTLYHDHGEVEAFVSGPEDEMLTYSTVKRYPEILETIEYTVKEITGNYRELGQRWMSLNPVSLMADFDVSIKLLSYNNDTKTKHDYPDTYWELERFFETEHNEEPMLLWQNEWIIRKCLENSCPCNQFGLNMVGIKSDVVIPGEDIILTQID